VEMHSPIAMFRQADQSREGKSFLFIS